MFVVLAVAALCGCAKTPPEFTGEAAWGYLEDQCAFGARVPGAAAHDSALRYIADHLASRGGEVVLQRFELPDPYGSGRLELTNIIGSFEPGRTRRVLLAAHYDSRPWADRDKDVTRRSRPVPGANDGASGVAVLLELADLLQDAIPRTIGVDLVFFDGEDYGKSGDLDYYLLGSKYFASNLGGYRPQYGILLDMVGGAGARIRQEGNSLDRAGSLTRELFLRAGRLDLDVFVPQRAQPIYDDHVPLLQAGIPTVDLIGLPYPDWHTTGDTADKCSPETLRQVGVLLRDFLYNFSF